MIENRLRVSTVLCPTSKFYAAMIRLLEALCLSLILLGVFTRLSGSTELTFELPDREEQCFYEEIDKDVNVIFEFQVCYIQAFVCNLCALFTMRLLKP